LPLMRGKMRATTLFSVEINEERSKTGEEGGKRRSRVPCGKGEKRTPVGVLLNHLNYFRCKEGKKKKGGRRGGKI